MKVACIGRYSRAPISAYSKETPYSKLEALGIDMTESVTEAEVVVYFDLLKSDLVQLKRSKYLKDKTVLIVMEPQVVIPRRDLKKFDKYFSEIYFLGRPPGYSNKTINWPQHWRSFESRKSSRHINNVILIAGNKLSLVTGELYSLRRACVFNLQNLDTFGSGWNSSTWLRTKILLTELSNAIRGGYVPQLKGTKGWFRKLETWKGSPESKDSVLHDYNVSLVIENSCEFLTEKIFDSFFAGCIPVYVGPNLIDFEIPEDLAVQVGPNFNEVSQGIDKALSMDYQTWQLNVKEWLDDPRTREKWCVDKIYLRLSRELGATR